MQSKIWGQAVFGPHFFELKSSQTVAVSVCLWFSVQGLVDPSRTATVLTSHAQLCERVLFPAPAGNVPGCRGAGPGVGEPLSLFSMESPAGHSLEQNADPHSPSFAMLCLSKVSRLLPSTLAQSWSRAHFLGHHPLPWPLLTWASRVPGGFYNHLTAYPLRCIFSFCALSEVPECLAFSGDCWLFRDAIVLSPSYVVPSEMHPKQVCILVLRIWTPGHVSLDTSGHLSMNWFGCTWTPLCQCEWDRAEGWLEGGLAGLGGHPHAGHLADVNWEPHLGPSRWEVSKLARPQTILSKWHIHDFFFLTVLIKLELFRKIDWWFWDCADQTTIQFCAVVHMFPLAFNFYTVISDDSKLDFLCTKKRPDYPLYPRALEDDAWNSTVRKSSHLRAGFDKMWCWEHWDWCSGETEKKRTFLRRCKNFKEK